MGFLTNNEIPESAGSVPIQKDVSNIPPPQRALFVATAIKMKPNERFYFPAYGQPCSGKTASGKQAVLYVIVLFSLH